MKIQRLIQDFPQVRQGGRWVTPTKKCTKISQNLMKLREVTEIFLWRDDFWLISNVLNTFIGGFVGFPLYGSKFLNCIGAFGKFGKI